MFTKEQIDRLLSQGGNVLSEDGEKIGSIGQVYVDNHDGQASWVTVRTGLFGMSESFVPLEGARTEGSDIVVPHSKNQVKDAPRIDADRALEPAEEDRLYQHYQLGSGRTDTQATTGNADSRTAVPDTTGYDTSRRTADATMAAPPQREATGTAAPDATGYDAAGGTADATMAAPPQREATGYDTARPTSDDTRTAPPQPDAARTVPPDATGYDTARPTSDDTRTAPPQREATGTVPPDATGYDAAGGTTSPSPQMRAATGTEQQAGGRTRLRKYVTTENVTQTVPVQREELRIKREPITEENRGEALSGQPNDDENEVILYEERIIVQKETVPVERVRIGTETVTDQVTVDEDVRKEHVGSDGPDENRR